MSAAYHRNKYKIDTYRAIQAAWQQIYGFYQSEFSEGNDFALAFSDTTQQAIKSFSMFGHECRASLSPYFIEQEDIMLGRLEFERMTSREEGKTILVLYIDQQANAGQEPGKSPWNFSRPQHPDFSRFGMTLAEAFFKSFEGM